MRLKVLREFVYVLIALVIFYMVIPILPTSLLIQLKDIEVTPGLDVRLTRTVTLPEDAYFSREVMRGSHIILECNRSGKTFFEQRGEDPVTFSLLCLPDEGDYTLRQCVTAIGPLGIRLRPSCISTDFTVGPSMEMRQMDLQAQIMLLEEQLNELKGETDEER